MTLVSRSVSSGLLAAALLFAGSAALASPPGHAPRACFEVDNFSWRAAGPDTLYIRSRVNEVVRLDLSSGSPTLESPGVHLIWVLHGMSQICSPHDAELYVSDGQGFRKPLFIKSITRLTPEEVHALPARLRP
jgi:hypothetical protein